MIFNTMVKGTDRKKPTGPSIQPQKTRERNITKVESPIPLPNIFGSIKLPIIMFTKRYVRPAHNNPVPPKYTHVNNKAGIAAIIEPILGMKLNKNAIIAHNIAYSTPIILREIYISNPVKKLEIVFIPRYLVIFFVINLRFSSAPFFPFLPKISIGLRSNVL